jgi:DNA polymerase-4
LDRIARFTSFRRSREVRTEATTTPTVLHADMDAFFAAIEQRDDPALRGRPVVVGGTSSRGVVAAASYEARVYGVHSAMPTVEARSRCPHAVFLRGDLRRYRRESRRIFEIFRRYTPSVESLSLDEAFLDLTGTERLLGDPALVGEQLRRDVRNETGLTVSVGIAPVKMVAKIASDIAKPDGLRLVRLEEVRAFLEPLPVARIWGVGPVAQERLRRLGITTVGDLARTADSVLHRELGRFGEHIAYLARGEDVRDVEPHRPSRSIGEENTFGEDVTNTQVLERALRSHAEAVARRLRRAGLSAGGVRIKVKLARRLGGGRFPLVTRSRKLPHPTDDGATLGRVSRELLRLVHLREPVRLVGVTAERLSGTTTEQLTFLPPEPGEARHRALNRALDEVHERFGPRSLLRGVPEIERAGLSLGVKRGEET